jgi:pilus assembly protein CpaE
VITVLSPKGGTGKTTMASNLAIGLGRSYPGRVVIVDLDVQFGDISTVLGLTPEHSMADVAKAPANLDATMLKVFLTPHDSGLYALCAPNTPAEADDITPANVARAIDLLRSEFAFVVIDTGAGLDEDCLVAIEHSTDLVFVGSTDVAGVRNVRKEIDVLDRLGLNGAQRHLVLNHADDKVGLNPEDIEQFIGLSINVSIPSSRLVPQSNNEGAPLLGDDPKSPVSRALGELVARFSERQQPDASGSGRKSWRHKRAS